MENQTYNGWTNYSTWCVHLWLSNESNIYFYIMDQAKEIKENPEYIEIGDEKILRDPTRRLADFIKHEIEESNPLIEQANLYSDVLSHALAWVNYQEIAKAFMESD